MITVQAEDNRQAGDPTQYLKKTLDYTPRETLLPDLTKDYLLFATIYDANMIELKKSYKHLHFEISLGQRGRDPNSEEKSSENLSYVTHSYRPEPITTTDKHSTGVDTTKYCRLNFGREGDTKKPCMHLSAELPDHEYRIKNRLLIKGIVSNLEIDVKKILAQYENQNPLNQTNQENLLKEVKTLIERAVKQLKNTVKGIDLQKKPNVNDLDRKLKIKRIKSIVSPILLLNIVKY